MAKLTSEAVKAAQSIAGLESAESYEVYYNFTVIGEKLDGACDVQCTSIKYRKVGDTEWMEMTLDE